MAPNDTVASQLVLGKFEGNYTNETKWVNMAVGSDGWEGNVTGSWDGNTNLFPKGSAQNWTATFQTGYPYIGMPARVFDHLAEQLEQQDEDIDCDHGFCKAMKNCTDIKPLDDLIFEMGTMNFTIPMNSTFYQAYRHNNKNNRSKIGSPMCMLLVEKL